MRVLRAGTRRRYLTGVWMLFAWCATIVEAATITGIVRDSNGKPLEGVQIKVICEQVSEKAMQVISGKDGTYRLVALPSSKCQLTAERSGFSMATPAVVTISSASASILSDFTLSQLLQEGDTTASQPRLKFEAAGVHGLIDPGGYSAPANAAAASGLISGIADIRRTENAAGFLASRELPCRLEPELTKAATENPENADANRWLGEFYLAHGAANRAIGYLKHAQQIDNNNSRTVMDLTEALLMTGQFDAARELLKPIPESKQDADYHQRLARAEEGLGQFIQASEEYKLAAEKDSTEENSFGIGYELILAGRPEAAVGAFHAGLEHHPSSISLLIGAGTAEFLRGHSSPAVTLFLQGAALNPSDPRPYPFLAEAFEISATQTEEVRASLKRHLELSPADADAHYLYALGLLHGSPNGVIDNDRVESLLKQAIILDPSLAKAHFQLGTVYAHRDDYDSAAREFEATVRLAADMKEAHYRLASAYKKTGRPEAAEHEMKLFREARDSSKTLNGEGGISIEQFISVQDRPGRIASNETQCSRSSIE
jgi:tetratricopeptide (TPR) repeat protein